MTVSARQNGAPAQNVPVFRTDLLIEPRPGGVFQVTAPGAPQGFLLYDLELALARLLDGRRTAADVLRAAGELGIAATPDSLAKFFRQLQQYGFLVQAPTARAPFRTVSPADAVSRREPVLKLWSEQKFEEALTYLEMLIGETPEDEGLLQLHEMLRRQMEAELASAAARAAKAPPAPAPAPESAPAPAEPSGPADDERADDLLKEVIESNPEALRRKRRRAARRRLAWLGALGAVGAALVLVQCPDRITEPCELNAAARAVVRSSVDSAIEEVRVGEGAQVKAGDVLVKLADFEFKRRLERIDAELAKAKAEQALLLRGARREEIRRAAQLVASRTREVKMAAARKKRLETLAAQQLASGEDYDAAVSELMSRESALAEAVASYQLIRAGPSPEELARKEAEIRAIEVERQLALPSLAATELKSPIDGVVVTPKVGQKVGTAVTPGMPVVEVADLKTMVADVYIPQAKADLLSLGLPVKVKVAHLPSRFFSGKVDFISLAVERRGEPPTEFIRVEARLDNASGLLLPQQTGYAEIDAGHHRLGALLFRGLVRWVRYRFVI